MNAWRRFVAWCGEQEGPLPIALARIAFGTIAFATVASVVVRGLVGDLYLPPAHGGMVGVGTPPWIVAALGGPTPVVVWSLVVVSLLSSAALTIGVGGRATAFVALQAFMGCVGLNTQASCSHTILITNALWLLVLADSTAALSVDARLRGGPKRLVAAFPRRLMLLQIVVVYFMAGVHKVSGHWVPFGDLSAVYYILRAPQWSAIMDPSLLVAIHPLTQLMTLGTWLFEWTSPLIIVWAWLRRDPARAGRLAAWARRFDARVPFAAVGLGMHAGIELTMTVGPFSAASAAYYLALWKHEEIAALAALLRRKS